MLEIKHTLMNAQTTAKKKIYGVKDIVEICGLSRNQVFHWSKTLRIINPEYITPGRQLFNFRAVLEFRFISELQKNHLDAEAIKEILELDEDIDTEVGTWTRRWPIWDIFLQSRWRYEREGFFLCSREKHQGPNSFIEYFVGTAEEVNPVVSREMERMPMLIKNVLIIDLLRIIREVEEKTGESLE